MQPAPDLSKDSLPSKLDQIRELLESGTFNQLRRSINTLAPVEVASLIESSPPPTRAVLWEFVDKDVHASVMEQLKPNVQQEFLQNMDAADLAILTEGWDADNLADTLQNLPEQVTSEVLNAMDARDRERLSSILAYEEDTAGGLTNPDTITVRPRITLDVVLRYLRRHDDLPHSTHSLYVVNKKDEYLGTLAISKLLTSDQSMTVRELMETEVKPIPANMPEQEVAKLFEQHDWISAPVVDENNKLIGHITIDDVVDVIRENADHHLMSMAGLDEEANTFTTISKTAPRRAVWLGINLITALLAASVINIFQGTIDKVVALAVLMPIVPSMGGVAGSQTLTVVIRGMALGHISKSNLGWLTSRECIVGLLNGALWGLITGAAVALWFDDLIMGGILAAAMLINALTAALAGALLPGALKRCNIDPALAGGVTLTTLTDVVGFLSFLGLATYFYG